MNRRAFLSTLAAGLAGATLDPERLLWTPGAKTIFLPSMRVLRVPSIGMAIRFVQSWDAVDSRMVNRFDTFYGGPAVEFLDGFEVPAFRLLQEHLGRVGA